MGVVSAIVQFLGPGNNPITNAEAQIGVAYALFDDAAGPVTKEVLLDVVAGLTFANRGSWKDVLVNAIIADAAARGHTLGPENVNWPCFEPGGAKLPVIQASWQKDVTKTNIGTSFANLYVGANGEAQFVGFARYRQYRLAVHGNKVGTGALSHQLAEIATANVIAGADYAGAAGEFSTDTGWTNLPAWAVGDDKIVRPQALSSVSTDDPIYRQVALYLR
jgi:hypothetical protein